MDEVLTKEYAEELFIKYSPYVFQIALFLTKSKSIADDVTQETFIKIFKGYKSYDSSKPIKPWIYKITLNVTKNILRKHKWKTILLPDMPDIQDIINVEDTVIKYERDNELLECIYSLPMKSREIILLHFYLELQLNEISIILNKPIGTCKSRLNTALNILRKKLPIKNIVLGDDNIEQI